MMKSSIKHYAWIMLILPILMLGCASPRVEKTQSPKVENPQSSKVEKPQINKAEKSQSSKAEQPASYAETIMSRPLPYDSPTRLSECGLLVSEINRQQGALDLAASLESGSPKRQEVMATYQSNVSVLRSRMMQVGCNRPVPPSPPSQAPH